MNDGFYPVTDWLPTYKIIKKGHRHIRVNLDDDFSSWIEHFQKLGLQAGRDFEIRSREEDGKRAIFRRGKSPFCDVEKYYPHSLKGPSC